MRNFLLILVLSGIFFLFLPGTVLAKENIVKQDSDNDGKIDRITYFDRAGKISKLEKDSDGDGRFEIVTLFKDSEPFEQLKDSNGKPDVWEEYDDTEALIKRKRDLDFDGRPDTEEKT